MAAMVVDVITSVVDCGNSVLMMTLKTPVGMTKRAVRVCCLAA
jgi:hypothetical protein